MLPQYNNKHNKVLLSLTDTLYIHILFLSYAVQFGIIVPMLQGILLLFSYTASHPIKCDFCCEVFKFRAFDSTCWGPYRDAARPGDRPTYDGFTCPPLPANSKE